MLLLAALLLAGSARAQTVIVKCVDAKGHVSYTTDVCAPGESVKDVKIYAPVRDDPEAREIVRRADEQQQAHYRARDRQQVYYPQAPQTETPRDRQKRECAQARQRANDARGKGYNNSTLVWLDKQAVDACFGL
jgi:hypothetical protein